MPELDLRVPFKDCAERQERMAQRVLPPDPNTTLNKTQRLAWALSHASMSLCVSQGVHIPHDKRHPSRKPTPIVIGEMRVLLDAFSHELGILSDQVHHDAVMRHDRNKD